MSVTPEHLNAKYQHASYVHWRVDLLDGQEREEEGQENGQQAHAHRHAKLHAHDLRDIVSECSSAQTDVLKENLQHMNR